ncbi:MAG: MFS transporter [Bacteroidales bacterium]|jgi:EmrB/QacA subfamily drug resistance transporter
MEQKEIQQKKNFILGLIMISSFVAPFLGASVNIALPRMSADLGMNAVTMSWVAMSYLLASAVFLVPLGKLADMIGRVKVFVLGNVIVVSASILCAIAKDSTMLIIFRVLQGIGSAMMFGTNMAIITAIFPPNQRGRAIGINVTAVYLGLSAAPVLGGILTQTFGWQSIFIVTIPFGIFVALAAQIVIKTDWAEAKNEKFDYKGSVIYVLSMSSFMYGFSKLPDSSAIVLAGLGIAGLLLFWRVELKTPFPVFNMQLFFGNRLFAMSNLAALINYATTFAVTFILSLYLQYVKGLSPRDAGFMLIAQPIMMAIVASVSGKLSDTYPPRILSSMGMGIIATGLILLLPLNEHTSNTYLILCLVLLGIGFGLFSSPNTNAIMGSVEKRYLGVASATTATMRMTGQMVSMGIATLVIHVFIGKERISSTNGEAFLHSASITFGIFILLSLIGIWASLARGKNTKPEL